jgi:hypothetical protein
MALVYDKKVVEGFKYIPESQREEKNPFAVTIVPIPSIDLVRLEDGLLQRSQDNHLSIRTGSYNVSLCLAAITGWENMLDANNKQAKIEVSHGGRITEKALSKIPTTLINEIAGVIAVVSADPTQIQLYTHSE